MRQGGHKERKLEMRCHEYTCKDIDYLAGRRFNP